MMLPRRDRVATVARGALMVLGLAALLIGSPIIIIGLYRSSIHFITPVVWFHYNDALDAPPLAFQLRAWANDTYQALRLDLGISGLVLLAFEVFFTGVWLKLLGLTLLTLWDLIRNGAEAVRERATEWGPRGWIANVAITLALSGTASPASAATAAQPVATAPHLPDGTRTGGHTSTGTTDTPATPGDHTQPPPRPPDVRFPDDLRPDCPRYRVHRGDTLSSISERELGTIARWHDLAHLNRFQLGTNPDHLEPGWVILLPPDAPPPSQGPTEVVTVERGDTLWSIAERELGTPNRWGELWDLNLRRTQPDGLRMGLPDRLLPGWRIVVPDEPHNKPSPGFTPTTPVPSRDPSKSAPWPDPFPPAQDTSAPPPTSSPPTLPPRADTSEPNHQPAPGSKLVTRRPGTAITVGNGARVAAALGGAVVAAMLLRRRRRLRAYRPNSGDRAPSPAPGPVVHALRWAHEHPHGDENDQASASRVLPEALPDEDEALPRQDTAETAIEIGTRDGCVHAVDVAVTSGLGLTGPGAPAAVRSLLVHLLARTPAVVVLTVDEAHRLLGADLPNSARLHITEDLDHALTTTAARTRGHNTDHHDEALHSVLIASADRRQPRLQSLLAAGKDRGLAVILLGQGPRNATARVDAQGIVEEAGSSLTELCDTRLFSLEMADTRELVDLFAETTSAPDSPLRADDGPDDAVGNAPADPQDHHHAGPGDVAVPQPQPQARGSTEPNLTDAPSTQPRVGNSAADSQGDESLSAEPDLDDNEPHRCWSLSVLGPLALLFHGHHGHTSQDVTAALSPKQKSLLAFLALYPAGTTREAVREALWADTGGGKRPFNAFYASLSQLRKALAVATGDDRIEIISQHEEHIALNPQSVTVDYWDLRTAERAMHTASDEEARMAAWSRIATLYRGELAEGMSALWLDGPRESAHRCVVDALAGMAAYYRGRNPQRQWQLLEHARVLNPENEAIYRDIMRVQAELGLTDGISRTLTLLTTVLSEINERPHPSTVRLARALQARHEDSLEHSSGSGATSENSA